MDNKRIILIIIFASLMINFIAIVECAGTVSNVICHKQGILNLSTTEVTFQKSAQQNHTVIGKGYRFDKNGWVYIHIEGEPFERGYQHGYLAAPEIKEVMRNLKYLSYWDTGKNWSFFVDAGEKIFVPHLEKEFLDEIKGIADGAKAAGVDVTWQEILAWNAYYELFYFWWPNEMEGKYAFGGGKERDHCSAFIATGNATNDGSIVIAHNTWEAYELAQFSNELLDIVPYKGHRIFMQCLPGYISSHTDFFVNDAGIMGTETAISGLNQLDLNSVIDCFRARKAMQYSDDLDQFAKAMIKDNNGGSADSWLLGDEKTGEIMRLELGLKYYNISKSKDGYYIGFNAPTDPRIRNLECSFTGYSDIRRHQGARQVRLTQLVEQYYGKIDIDIAKAILADHYDVYLNKTNPSSRTIDGHYELDPMEYATDPGEGLPFQPQGTVDGTVTNSSMARNLSLFARWGNSAGMPFDATTFMAEHIQWSYLKGYLKDRPSQPWTEFKAESI